jgi:hypothetical protein
MNRGISRRQRELDRQRKKKEKEAKREQRKLEKQERIAADLPSDQEQSLAEIVPGPQPLPEGLEDLADAAPDEEED